MATLYSIPYNYETYMSFLRI